MSVERNLNSIGREKFVNYFYEFRDLSNDQLIELFSIKNLKPEGTHRRISAFQQIRRRNKYQEALTIIICKSPKLLKDKPEVIENAKKIYQDLGFGQYPC